MSSTCAARLPISPALAFQVNRTPRRQSDETDQRLQHGIPFTGTVLSRAYIQELERKMNTTIYETTIHSIQAATGASEATALDAFESVFRDGYSVSGITRSGACAMHGGELTQLAVSMIEGSDKHVLNDASLDLIAA